MKVHKAKSVLHQHDAAIKELDARREALLRVERRIEQLGEACSQAAQDVINEEVEAKRVEAEIEEHKSAIERLKQEQVQRSHRIKSLRSTINAEPLALRIARQEAVQAKDRIASQHKLIERWSRELPEAQATMDEFLTRKAANEAAERAAMEQAKAGALAELTEKQLAGKIPADVDVKLLVDSYFEKRRHVSVLRQRQVAR